MSQSALSSTQNRSRAAFSLSLKIASVVVAVSVIGIIATTLLITRVVEGDFQREFQASRNEIARQLAANMAGAMRWKKADVIGDTYKQLVEDAKKPIASLATVTAGGELLTQYAEPGRDAALLVNLPKSTAGEPASVRSISRPSSFSSTTRARFCRARARRSISARSGPVMNHRSSSRRPCRPVSPAIA